MNLCKNHVKKLNKFPFFNFDIFIKKKKKMKTLKKAWIFFLVCTKGVNQGMGMNTYFKFNFLFVFGKD